MTGRSRFSGVDFSGTLFINNDDDDDFAGIVFSYQSSSAFYVITWKKKRQTYWEKTPFPAIAEPGLQLKVSTAYAPAGTGVFLLLLSEQSLLVDLSTIAINGRTSQRLFTYLSKNDCCF